MISFSGFSIILPAQNYYPVKMNQKWGLIDAKGQLIVPPKYEVIGTPQKYGYILMQEAKKIGLMNRKGEPLLPAKYEEIKILSANFISLKENGQQKIVNTKGELILEEISLEKLQIIHPNYMVFKSNGKFGCVNSRGHIIIEPQFDNIELFQESFFKIKNNQYYGLTNQKGKEVLPVKNDEIQILNNKLIFYLRGVLWGAVDFKGNKIISPKYNDYSSLNSSLIKLERFGRHSLYNIPLKKIVSDKPVQDFLPFYDEYILTRQGNNFGLIDFEAKEILPTQFLEIQSFSKSTFRVRNGWKWGIIDNKNTPLLNFEYDFIGPLRNGNAMVKKNKFFGLINVKGELVLPAEYNRITISGENIKAFKDNKWTLFYIDEHRKAQEVGNFKKHFNIQIAENSMENQLNWQGQDGFNNNYLLDNFEWFYDSELRKWGLRSLADGEIVIDPIYDSIKIERDLGYTVVGIENQGQYRFDRTNYRFNNIYGIVNNKVGKLVTQSGLVLWDVRSEDFRNGSLVARVVFNNGRHGLMLQNGKFVKKDYAYIGEFKDGLAKISISGKISAQLNGKDKSLGLLPNYLNNLMVGSDMVDFTLHDKKFKEEAFLTCEGCKWGFIDTTAEVTIQPKYEIVQDFVNDVCIIKEKGKWGLIDRSGNNLMPKKYDYLDFLDGTDNQMIKLANNDKKYGLMDTSGQLIINLVYDDLSIFQEGRLAVKKGNLWGFVNNIGQEIIPPQYQKIASFSEGLAAVKYQRKWVFINPMGKIILADNYRAAGNFKEGRAWVKTDKGVGYINQQGEIIIPFDLSQAFDFRNGVARVLKNGKWGLIDLQGNFILKPRFSKISPFDEYNLAIVHYGNKITRYGIINQKGVLITKQNYRKIHPFKEGRALVKHQNGYGFINTKGELIIEGNYSKAADFSEGKAMVQRNNSCGFIDLLGKEIIPLIYSKCLDFKEGKAVVYKGLKNGGIIDQKGKEIIEPSINRLIDFKEGRGLVRKGFQFYYIAEDATWRDGYFEKAERYKHGIAAIKKEGKWGIINQNGINLISNKYDEIKTFNNGFAKVQLRQFSGLVDLKGNLIIPPEYEIITYAGDDLFRIENGGKIGYLRKDGVWVWDLQE